jgi:hypothetical protein
MHLRRLFHKKGRRYTNRFGEQATLPRRGLVRCGRARQSGDADLDAAPERGEEGHQPFHRKGPELGVLERRHLRLVDGQERGRRLFGQATCLESAVDRDGPANLRLEAICIRQSKIREDVA